MIKERPPTDSTAKCTCTRDSSVSLTEIIAWLLVSILTVPFTGLLSVVLLCMFKKRQARDTSTDNSIQSIQIKSSIKLPVALGEVVAWVLVSILTVLFTGLLSVVLLWMFKKRQARDTSTDNSAPKHEMEGNPCYEATAVKQTTDTHFYEAIKKKKKKKKKKNG